MKTLFFIALLAFPFSRSAEAGVADSLWTCFGRLGLLLDSYKTASGWFGPQFKTKGDAERWLLSMVPKYLDPTEKLLLTEWPRQGYSLSTNEILRAGNLDTLGGKIIIPEEFSVQKIVDVFDHLHARSQTDREITVYRAIGGDQIGQSPDQGLMNVSLDLETVRTHGRNRALKSGRYVLQVLKVPKGYPLVPTFAHHAYRDSTGRENIVSVELEMTLARGTGVEVDNSYLDAEGVQVVEARVSLSK